MKRTIRKAACLVTAALLAASGARAQESGRHYPMYFTGGIPVRDAGGAAHADLKFQVGASVTLLKGIGGREGLDLDFVYNQVSTWDFFDHSSPFRDNTYMPGLFLSVPVGGDLLETGIEHRSNGRPLWGSGEDPYSRSANYVFARYFAFFPGGFVLKASVRAGYGWYGDEPSVRVITSFVGHGELVLGYRKGRWEAAVTATPVFGPFRMDLKAEAACRVGACSLFVQYSDGHEDALCDWVWGRRPAAHLRAGVLLGHLL